MKNILGFIGFDIQSINLLFLSIFWEITIFSSYLLGVERLYEGNGIKKWK